MLAELDADGIPEVSVNDVDDINFMIEKVQHKFQSDIANAKKKFEKVRTEKQNRIIIFSFEPSIGTVIRKKENIKFFSENFCLNVNRNLISEKLLRF